MGYQLYKGYVEVDSTKEVTQTYKGKDSDKLASLVEARKFPGFAGVLNAETVMLDADDAGQATALVAALRNGKITSRVMQTKRGVHCTMRDSKGYITDCSTHVELMCGIIVDIKTGRKAAVDILKLKGVERAVLSDADDTHDYSDIPEWCQVFRYKVTKATHAGSLFGLADGDGRDNALYGRIKDLYRKGLSNDGIKECIHIINTCVFAEPLDDATMKKFEDGIDSGLYKSEVDEEEAAKPIDLYVRDKEGKAKGIDYDKAAKYLIEKLGCCRMYGNILWIACDDGTYRAGKDSIYREVLKSIPNIESRYVSEILTRIELWAPEVTPAPANLIAFNNGILDVDTMQMTPATLDMHIVNKIPHDFHADAYSSLMDSILNKLTDGDVDNRLMIGESIGLCMYRKNRGTKALYVYYGESNCGKSTLIDLYSTLFGAENVSSLNVSAFSRQFGKDAIAGKLANVRDEISDAFGNSDVAEFVKSVTSGNTVSVDRKFMLNQTFSPYCGMIFGCNNLPTINDSSGATQKRFYIIPFDHVFSRSDPDFDPEIGDKLDCEEVYEYLLRLGVEGIRRWRTTKVLTRSAGSIEASREYAMQCNPIEEFVSEINPKFDVYHKPTEEVYTRYCVFCTSARRMPVSKQKFVRQMKSLCHVESKVMRKGEGVTKCFEPIRV